MPTNSIPREDSEEVTITTTVGGIRNLFEYIDFLADNLGPAEDDIISMFENTTDGDKLFLKLELAINPKLITCEMCGDTSGRLGCV